MAFYWSQMLSNYRRPLHASSFEVETSGCRGEDSNPGPSDYETLPPPLGQITALQLYKIKMI